MITPSLIVLVFVLGAMIGSFINALEYRLYSGISIIGSRKDGAARSMCPHCKHTLGFADLVPVLSFLFLKGRCRYCTEKISVQYPLVELVCGAAMALVAWRFGWSPETGVYLVFTTFLLFLFLYDLKYMLIPDSISIPAVIISFILGAFVLDSGVVSQLLGAAAAGGFFLAQFVVSRGKWIGGGDIRLGALMGVMLGWPHALFAVLAAYIIGAVVASGLLLVKRKKRDSQIAFGTFLAAATYIFILYGDPLVSWYLNAIGL